MPGFTYDAAVLEFDIVATEPTIEFKYVFGSEEYLEYVGSNFNDVFGFFIGAIGDPLQNIAFIPDTTVAVSINNVKQPAFLSTISIMAMASRVRKTPTRNMCNTMV
ncbi:MAG: choice-of-anchor L domain-containing protein [Sphingobacteriales bacterium]|nr:choice-of-anchor L domain-containing protein [Sphingobacteriales bacterium]